MHYIQLNLKWLIFVELMLMKRLFIVGVARSGTTLLQSFFAADMNILTFPESHLFRLTVPRSFLKKKLKRVTFEDVQKVKYFLESVGMDESFRDYKDHGLGVKSWIMYILETFDRMAKSAGRDIWLEKTPMHLHYVNDIRKIDPNVVFIHMVRNPYDNISALYDVSKKHPDVFHQVTLDQSLERYLVDMKVIQSLLSKPNNYIVYYEDLVSDPQHVLSNLCEEIQVRYSQDIGGFKYAAEKISTSSETWKLNNKSDLSLVDKLNERLSGEEFKFLKSQSSLFDMPVLERYKSLF